MSTKQDIRNFFSRKGGGKEKRKRDEDDDDDNDFRSAVKKPINKKSKKGAVIYDSDSDTDVQIVKTIKAKSSSRSNGSVNKLPKKTPPPAVKKRVTDAAAFFGSSPVQRSAKKTNKSTSQLKTDKSEKPRLELEDHGDDDFTKTLEELDQKNTTTKSQTAASKLADKVRKAKVLAPETPEADAPRRSPRKRVLTDSTPTKKTKTVKREENNNLAIPRHQDVVTSSPQRSSSRLQTPEKSKEATKAKKQTVVTPKGDQITRTPKQEAGNRSKVSAPTSDTAERKKGGGQAYRSYLQREGPRYLGTKELPQGQDGCLDGLSFVITGMMEYFSKDELKDLIEGHGGALRTSISKKTSYVVIGREPGEAKTQKAQDLKIKTLDEDGLYDMIRTRPGKKKPAAKTSSESAKPSNQKTSSNSVKTPEKPKPASTQTFQKHKEQFSWRGSQSQGTDSQGSEVNSQESLGKLNVQDGKPTNQSPPSLQMWVDKYKPNNTKQIIGQQGDRSNAKKLAAWLRRWHDNNFGQNKDKARFNRDDGFSFKAALLSGPPGVGKTTTAQIVCKELGFVYYEMNASDARSKKTLKECVSEYLGNTVIGDFFGGHSKVRDHHKHCLIMDEIDGMSGNEDRGGIQEVIQLIKGSHVPIICICNDRSHPKIRSLCNYCFDLRFQRPRLQQIKSAMMSVAFKEGVKIPPAVLDNMIMASNQDVRQVLHNMSMWAAGTHRDSTDGKDPEAVKKDLKLGPWDVLRQVFSNSEETKKMTFNDKVSLFFHDYSIAPLFVQENYPNVIPHQARGDIKRHLDLLSKTADSIANGDLVDKHIRSGMQWKLLPLQAVFASVLPGEYMRGHLGGMINFPSWLGKNSTRGKSHRLLQELQTHMRMSAAVALQSVNQEYLPRMRGRLTDPLVSEGTEGVETVVDFMNNYDLTREDFDNILELTQYPGMKEPMKSVPPKVKSAFTRTFNKSSHLSPYAMDLAPKGKAKKGPAVGFEEDGEGEGDTQEPEDEEEDDAAIIAKLKAKSSSKGATASKKGKGPAKGKGKGKGTK